jgi:hypothetical protein
MNSDFDTLKTEILDYLEKGGFVVFHGLSRLGDPAPSIHWDAARFPDFKLFLDSAKQAGAGLIVFHHRQFAAEDIDEGLEELEESGLPVEEQRSIEHRLHEMRAFEGFTCALELSFDLQGRTYIFNLRAEWYEDFLDAVDEIESSLADEGEDGEAMGGYFSRN